jgi:hypothetical protein
MKTRLATLLLVMVLVLIGVFAYFWWHGNQGVRSPCDRIRVGMTLEDVESLLGPGEELPVRLVPKSEKRTVDGHVTTMIVEGERFFRWYGELTTVYIGFKDNKVYEKKCFELSF